MLDFSKNEKKHFQVKLRDGRLLCVYAPTLDLLEDFSKINVHEMDVQSLRSVLSGILSNNMQKAKVAPAQIGELTMPEIEALIEGITNFVNEVASSKN